MKKKLVILCLLLIVTGCGKEEKGSKEIEIQKLTCYRDVDNIENLDKTIYIFDKEKNKAISYEMIKPVDMVMDRELSDEDKINNAKSYCEQYAINIAGDKTNKKYKELINSITCNLEIVDNKMIYTISSSNFDILADKYDYNKITILDLKEKIEEKDEYNVCNID